MKPGGKFKQLKKARSTTRTGPYKHLMTGVSDMLPVVVAGGLLIALAFAFGGIYAGDAKGTFGWALMQIGGAAAFALFVPPLGLALAATLLKNRFSADKREASRAALVLGISFITQGAMDMPKVKKIRSGEKIDDDPSRRSVPITGR